MKRKSTNITRDNYAVFLAEFMEGNLSRDQEFAFWSFINQHPDLREDLDHLLEKDFPFTEQLGPNFDFLKQHISPSSAEKTWDEWLIDRLEGNLTVEEKGFINEMIQTHESLNKEAALFELTKISPDAEDQFPDKSTLYKKPKAEGNVIAFPGSKILLRIAALLVMIIATGFFLFNNSNQSQSVKINPVAAMKATEDKDPESVMQKQASKNHKEAKMPALTPESDGMPAKAIRQTIPVTPLGFTEIPENNIFRLALVEEKREIQEYIPEGVDIKAGDYFGDQKVNHEAWYRSIYSSTTRWLAAEDTTALERINAPDHVPGLGVSIASKGLGFINRISGFDLKIAQTFSTTGEVKKIGIASQSFAFQWTPR